MKKKLIIIIPILIVIISLLIILLINREPNYYEILKEKLDNTTNYTIGVQLSNLEEEIVETDLNYSIEGNDYTLSLYEINNSESKNYFYQKYDNKYYLDDKEIESFKYSSYDKYIDIVKYITDIKLENNEYKGIINKEDIESVMDVEEDGIVFLTINDNLISEISIVADSYTINIKYTY